MNCENCQNTGMEWIVCYVCNGKGCQHCNNLGEEPVFCGCQYGQKLKEGWKKWKKNVPTI